MFFSIRNLGSSFIFKKYVYQHSCFKLGCIILNLIGILLFKETYLFIRHSLYPICYPYNFVNSFDSIVSLIQFFFRFRY